MWNEHTALCLLDLAAGYSPSCVYSHMSASLNTLVHIETCRQPLHGCVTNFDLGSQCISFNGEEDYGDPSTDRLAPL